MLNVIPSNAALSELDVDVLIVPVFKGGIEGPGTGEALRAVGLDAFPVTPSFRGDVEQTLLIAAPGQPFRAVLLVGVSRMDAVSPRLLQRVAGAAVQAVPTAKRMATTLAQIHPTRDAIEAVADGLRLGLHRSRHHAATVPDTELAPEDREVQLLVPSAVMAEAAAAVEHSAVRCRSIMMTRDWVNMPPSEKRPVDFAASVNEAMPETIEVQIYDEAWLEEQNCGGILGVGRGSEVPPRLVELSWKPEAPLAHLVLVGKGITFDTGGSNIKPTGSIETMKCDMGGAAVVAGVMAAVGTLQPRVAVTGLLAVAENAIGANAQLPSDVITTFNGTTVEVVHTDAEGRLVMADALGYGVTLEPDAIIDLATLTGASIAALGPWMAAAMGNDDDLIDLVLDASEDSGEAFWQLPLPEDLDRLLESRVADVDNLGRDSGGGALLAGLFLQRFVDDTPWVHLDIAGPAFLSGGDVLGHQPEGATGFGVGTVMALIDRLQS